MSQPSILAKRQDKKNSNLEFLFDIFITWGHQNDDKFDISKLGRLHFYLVSYLTYNSMIHLLILLDIKMHSVLCFTTLSCEENVNCQLHFHSKTCSDIHPLFMSPVSGVPLKQWIAHYFLHQYNEVSVPMLDIFLQALMNSTPFIWKKWLFLYSC